MTEPTAVCSTFLGCIYDFQALLTGFLAVLAAFFTARAIWRAAHLPVEAQERREKDLVERRRRHGCLLLCSELQELRRRASQSAASIRVYIAANKDVTDAGKERIYLAVPSTIEDWEIMSRLPDEILQRCLNLNQRLNDHNFDIAGAGGAFGADNFREHILGRLDGIMTESTNLAGSVGNVQQAPSE